MQRFYRLNIDNYLPLIYKDTNYVLISTDKFHLKTSITAMWVAKLNL